MIPTTYLVIGSVQYAQKLNDFIFLNTDLHKDNIEPREFEEAFDDQMRTQECFCIDSVPMFVELIWEELKFKSSEVEINGELWDGLRCDDGSSLTRNRESKKLVAWLNEIPTFALTLDDCCKLRDALREKYCLSETTV